MFILLLLFFKVCEINWFANDQLPVIKDVEPHTASGSLVKKNKMFRTKSDQPKMKFNQCLLLSLWWFYCAAP